MNMPSSRSIQRIALLEDYQNRPEKLMDMVEEVAAKGYHGVDFWIYADVLDAMEALCEKADGLGLSTGVPMPYMIGQYKHIAHHPEQRFVEAVPGLDIDGLGTDSWGCPYNPDFKKRYCKQLEKMSRFPGMARILVNDEASMSNGCYCDLCLAEYKKTFGDEMPRLIDPKIENWREDHWRQFLKWRIDRWTTVHGEMADVIHAVNPAILVGFQTSPGVDLWQNPWGSAVDLHAMARKLDMISVDPYYTSHKHPGFMPMEVYLSEWCRFLRGIVPTGKPSAIIPQGFSHPNFTRPLHEADGLWAALVPAACGNNIVGAYTYTLQRCSPMLDPYEDCFRFDSYFEKTEPVKYAAVVHGIQTEIYAHPLPRDVMNSYDGTRLFPVAESLRHHGVPYGYFPDAMLNDTEAMSEYEVIILPQVECLSADQARAIQSFSEDGGNLLILGPLGAADEIGSLCTRSLLEQLTGIQITGQCDNDRAVVFRDGLGGAAEIPTVDDVSAGYTEGSLIPVSRLHHCVDITIPADAEVLAYFADDHENQTGQPAVVSLKRGGGNIIFFAGFPSHNTVNPILGSEVRNITHHWFATLAKAAAGRNPALRVASWPPRVPIQELRPVDRRHINTFEFFPLQGDELFLALITSYFRESTTFPICLDVPDGKELGHVKELLSDQTLPFKMDKSTASIHVEMDFDTAAKLFAFEFK
jgi:hypothetical protein